MSRLANSPRVKELLDVVLLCWYLFKKCRDNRNSRSLGVCMDVYRERKKKKESGGDHLGQLAVRGRDSH